MKKILTGLILALGLVQVAAAETARDRLNAFFTNVNTMQSSFIQEVFDEQGNLKQSSRGTVFLVRPGRFRWEYAQPEAHKIISDGKDVYVYDVELEQVTIKPMRQSLSSAPVAMLLNKQPVDSQFQVQAMQTEDSSLSWFHLVPHRRDSDFTSMDLGISERGIQEMVLNDKFGQQTYVHFHGMQLDVNIDPNRFRFTPPQGVDVIGRPS
ncbi:MAG: outer membrane lipoprotein chaperone LolA [Thiothrix sp.]|nr:outer membrane lipoprotein chaperone LolA [Thiothrix sp.]HPQ95548.1 outer membrane lipoprotein chaperone LolA [Thiolinea sp.]